MIYKTTITGPDWIDIYDTADFDDFDRCIAAQVAMARNKGADDIRIYNGSELFYYEDLTVKA